MRSLWSIFLLSLLLSATGLERLGFVMTMLMRHNHLGFLSFTHPARLMRMGSFDLHTTTLKPDMQMAVVSQIWLTKTAETYLFGRTLSLSKGRTLKGWMGRWLFLALTVFAGME